MIYPSLNCSKVFFTPSLLFSLDDPILGGSFLTMVSDFYVGGVDGVNSLTDYLLSPRLVPDHILKEYPPTRINIAGLCPLRDEQYKLIIRLSKLKVDVKGVDFRHFVHCFIGFGKSHNIPEYDEAVE